jgi:hypothetical protein
MLKFAVLENINWFWLIIAGLAAWRLTNIIHWEGIAAPIRKIFGGHYDKDHDVVYEPLRIFGKEVMFFASLMSCFWCLSVWVSMLVIILVLVFPWILLPFAISAVAIIIERLWNQ